MQLRGFLGLLRVALGSLLTLVGLAASVSPHEAILNLSKWAGLVIEQPQWLGSAITQKSLAIAIAMCGIAAILWPTLSRRWGHKVIPVSEAARIAYEVGRENDSAWTHAADQERARRGGNPSVSLDYVAGIISGLVPIFGKHPPSNLTEDIRNMELQRPMVFRDGGVACKFVGNATWFTDVVIREKDMGIVLDYFRSGLKTTSPI